MSIIRNPVTDPFGEPLHGAGGFLDGLAISTSAISAERVRMNVIADNLANANTTRTEEGGPYKRKDVIFTARNSPVTFDELERLAFDPNLKEVKVDGIIEDQRAPRMVFDPSHPDADGQGFVAMPNISTMEEMVNLITSERNIESNTEMMQSMISMASKAISIGSR